MYSKQRFGVLNHPKISIDYLVKYLDEGRGEKGERRNQKEERRKKKGERLKCPTGAKELSPG